MGLRCNRVQCKQFCHDSPAFGEFKTNSKEALVTEWIKNQMLVEYHIGAFSCTEKRNISLLIMMPLPAESPAITVNAAIDLVPI